MSNECKYGPSAPLGRCRSLAVLAIFVFGFSASAQKSVRHLFILSGQSNMTGGLKAGFAQKVEHLRQRKHRRRPSQQIGRGIRFWDKDYRFPMATGSRQGSPSNDPSNSMSGIRALDRKFGGHRGNPSIPSLSSGCRASRMEGVVWAGLRKSFLVIEADQTRLGKKDLGFVIGRINNSG